MFQALLSWITPHAYAVVDADIASTSATMLDTVKESVFDVFTSNGSTIALIVGMIIVVGLVIRLAKRVSK